MSTDWLLSVALLALGLAAFLSSGHSGRERLVFLVLAIASVILLIAHRASDYFTGEGINEAVVFHLRYGFKGAGFGEYRSMITMSAIALVVVPIALLMLIWRRPHRPRRGGYLWAGYVFIIASVAVNPAMGDLFKLATPPPPQAADFRRHYRIPAISPISSEHPNFIFIFAESFERTYFDETRFPGLIKELRTLETEATSFTELHTVYGTGFTMGGMVASLCGVPLVTPAHPNSMSGMDNFLPGAVALSDLLHDQGYFLSFMGGAYLHFAGKGKFLKTHQFDETFGFTALHPKVPDRTYITNWGLYDDTLLDLAFAHFVELSQQKKRFGLFLLTLDTHHPDGHLSKSVAGTRNGDGSNSMLNAVAGSDRLLAQFVRRVQASPFGRNTVIAIASDHLAMNNAATSLLERGPRRNLFLVLDPRHPVGTKVEREGSTLDTGTTLLPFLGYKGSIGFGRDLRDPLVKDEELAHIRDEQTLLSWQGELERFWEFPRFRQTLSFVGDPAALLIDGRQFSAPVLVEFGRNYQTTLRFEFDAAWDVRLTQQAERLNRGTTYVLVVKREDAGPLLPGGAPPITTPWVMILGKAGMSRAALPLPAGAVFSKEQIRDQLARLR